MNLYGRPLTGPIDPAADRVPILDASAEGDENKMRDVTVAQLVGAASRIKEIEGGDPTAEDVPDGTWNVCRTPDGKVMLCANAGGQVHILAMIQP